MYKTKKGLDKIGQSEKRKGPKRKNAANKKNSVQNQSNDARLITY
jgi:hypothetical protein